MTAPWRGASPTNVALAAPPRATIAPCLAATSTRMNWKLPTSSRVVSVVRRYRATSSVLLT